MIDGHALNGKLMKLGKMLNLVSDILINFT